MNHIQHFGAGALVATFGIFAMSSIATQANFFAIENSNAIYSAATAGSLQQTAQATEGRRPVDSFNASVRSTSPRQVEVRGTVTSITGDVITVKTDSAEWTGKVVADTKFPMTHGMAVQMKPMAAHENDTNATSSNGDSHQPNMLPPMIGNDQAGGTQAGIASIQVGDRVAMAGRLVGPKTLRLSMVRAFDIHPGVKTMPSNATSTKAVRGIMHPMPNPMPMPNPVAPIEQRKPAPGVAQPVPMPRD